MKVWVLPLLFLTLLHLLFISWGLLCCLQGQSITNEDAINRKPVLIWGFVFTLPGRAETVSVSDTNQHTHKILSIYHVSSFIYLLDTPKHPTCQHSNWKFTTPAPWEVWHSRGCDYETHLLSGMTILIGTEKSGYFWMRKRKLFLSYFISYLTSVCFCLIS